MNKTNEDKELLLSYNQALYEDLKSYCKKDYLDLLSVKKEIYNDITYYAVRSKNSINSWVVGFFIKKVSEDNRHLDYKYYLAYWYPFNLILKHLCGTFLNDDAVQVNKFRTFYAYVIDKHFDNVFKFKDEINVEQISLF